MKHTSGSWDEPSFPAHPTVAVDAIILFEPGKIVLIKRRFPPFKDFWALPGGIVKYGESVEEALLREVKEETGLTVKIKKLVGVYSNPNRDPRGHVISICFLCEFSDGVLKASSDAADINVFSLEEVSSLQLAFDHLKMIIDSGVL
ncbi:MAG: NUDIX hydrolase [Candidatus Odinarchaeum yellowstonii]|uniref:NUDIX hydrolase n=1 Tax=Odinarchaeota yellowstonii (strain LCB_4) TaxID=1841599 RepID=A0AAF0IBU2_ODILC|nr:MAG: NUDIX hydrolase [Candidatus Odinarchaeum yellowstonii]